ncbi:MAG: hypothetical protein WA126_14850 [Thermodesulfovibrionales bacterium]
MSISNNKETLIQKKAAFRYRIAELAVGITTKDLTDRAFDYLLYPFVIYQAGILKGGLVMTFLALIANILTMKFYDWSKRDWLGIEAIKEIKTYKGTRKIGRFTSWIMKKSDSLIFLFMSVKFDPFITTAYLRHGANQFNGMNRRDWKIFIGSLILSNAYWTLACYMGITLVEWGWKMVNAS